MTDRRQFLGLLGATSLLTTLGTPTDALAEAPRPVNSDWDMSWFDRLTGKRVAVFDSPGLSEGAALFRAVMWRAQMAEVYGTPIHELASVVVLRHTAIPLVMNNAFWERYDIGKQVKLKDPTTKKWTRRNPLLPSEDMPPAAAEYTLPGFMATGGIVLACDLAFSNCVATVAAKEKFANDAARTRALTMLIPGVILQPSGFFAVMKAQETGGGYILGS